MPLLVFHLIIETTVWGLQTDTQQARENSRGSADSRVRPTSTGEHDSCGTHAMRTALANRAEPCRQVPNLLHQAGMLDAISEMTNQTEMSSAKFFPKP